MTAPFALDRPDVAFEAIVTVLGGIFPTVPRHQLRSDERENRTIAWVRQLGMFLAVEHLGWSYGYAAQWWDRDRTTVRHAVELVHGHAAALPSTAGLLACLREQLTLELERLAILEGEGAL